MFILTQKTRQHMILLYFICSPSMNSYDFVLTSNQAAQNLTVSSTLEACTAGWVVHGPSAAAQVQLRLPLIGRTLKGVSAAFTAQYSP